MADEKYTNDEDDRSYLQGEDQRGPNLEIEEDHPVDTMFDDDPWESEVTPVVPDYNEETATEFAARPISRNNVDDHVFDEENDDVTSGRGIGSFAIVLSILSLFFLPVLLGIAGIVVGFISRRNGAKALGNWAIGIGAVSIIMKVFFAPFF